MAALDLMGEAAAWRDTVVLNKAIVERFKEYVDADAELKAHRDFIKKHVYGFGERSFWWLWKLIVDEMPATFRFLEIGVYKGATPSVVRLLATRTGKRAEIFGVTPLSSFAGVTGKFPPYPETDYRQHITDLHDHFGQEMPRIAKGSSTNPKIRQAVGNLGPFDLVYVDGCHEYDYVVKDLMCYGAMVKEGGLLVVDDSANYLAPVWGFFQGIEDVSAAVRAIIETDSAWEHLLAVMHLRVWRKVAPTGIGALAVLPVQEYKWVTGPGGNVAVAQ